MFITKDLRRKWGFNTNRHKIAGFLQYCITGTFYPHGVVRLCVVILYIYDRYIVVYYIYYKYSFIAIVAEA
jgi:hypothetical protein